MTHTHTPKHKSFREQTTTSLFFPYCDGIGFPRPPRQNFQQVRIHDRGAHRRPVRLPQAHGLGCAGTIWRGRGRRWSGRRRRQRPMPVHGRPQEGGDSNAQCVAAAAPARAAPGVTLTTPIAILFCRFLRCGTFGAARAQLVARFV